MKTGSKVQAKGWPEVRAAVVTTVSFNLYEKSQPLCLIEVPVIGVCQGCKMNVHTGAWGLTGEQGFLHKA